MAVDSSQMPSLFTEDEIKMISGALETLELARFFDVCISEGKKLCVESFEQDSIKLATKIVEVQQTNRIYLYLQGMGRELKGMYNES